MGSKAREFLEFWIQNSVHAAEQYGAVGGEQGTAALARRCIEMASSQGISESELTSEVGDLADYIGGKLEAANKTEGDRRGRHRN